jgi:hypothetical protein
MFVVGLELRLDAVVDHPGAEPASGATGDLAAEDELHVVRTTQRELVFEGHLKPLPDLGGALGHARVRQFELADRQAIGIAAFPIGGGQR